MTVQPLQNTLLNLLPLFNNSEWEQDQKTHIGWILGKSLADQLGWDTQSPSLRILVYCSSGGMIYQNWLCVYYSSSGHFIKLMQQNVCFPLIKKWQQCTMGLSRTMFLGRLSVASVRGSSLGCFTFWYMSVEVSGGMPSVTFKFLYHCTLGYVFCSLLLPSGLTGPSLSSTDILQEMHS